MPSGLVATILALFSIGCAFVVCHLLLFRSRTFVYFFCWAAFAPCIFLIRNPVLFIALIAAIMAGAMAIQRRNQPALFTAIFPAVPGALGYIIPLPGLNYLFTLTYARLAVLIGLAPSILAPRPWRRQNPHTVLADWLLLIFFSLVVIMNFRGLPLTSGFRNAFYSLLEILIPYLVFSRTISNRAALFEILKAFLIAALIMCFIGLVSELKQWNFYDFASPLLRTIPPGFAGGGPRFGLMRVGATLNPAFLAFILSVAILVLEYVRIPLHVPRTKARLVQLILLVGAVVTTGRGGWLGGMAAALAYGILSTRSRGLRVIAWMATISIAGFVTLAFATHGNLYFLDPYGTVKYRVDLIFNSIRAISQNPFFGSIDFRSDAALQASRQGQGIIDIVNTYLGISLRYGLVTMGIFLTIYGVIFRQLLRVAKRLRRLRLHDEENACYLMISILLGYMIFIGTISTVSLIFNYGFIFLGLSVATIRLAHGYVRETTKLTNRRAARSYFSSRDFSAGI